MSFLFRRLTRKRLFRKATICIVIFGLLLGVWLFNGQRDVHLPPCPWQCGKRVFDGGSEYGRFNISVYLEYQWMFIHYYGNYYNYANLPYTVSDCSLPNGAKCILQNSDVSADVLLRLVVYQGILIDTFLNIFSKTKMCDKQMLAVLNSEAGASHFQRKQLNAADIRIDYHPSSDVFVSEACGLPLDVLEHRTPPDPSKRKGIAMFVSNCAAKWRANYLQELMKHVHIDSYGACFHNARLDSVTSTKYDSLIETAKKYRMVVCFENTITSDYITEKISLVYTSGAIPVYWGPPQIYSWTPGNHSFIDASVFSAKDLANYLKKVNEDDDLFRYHTTNLDIDRSRAKVKHLCRNTHYICRLCQVAYRKKTELCHSSLW